MPKHKRKQPFKPEIHRQVDTRECIVNAHQVIVRLPILTSLKILSLRRYIASVLKDNVRDGTSHTSIRPGFGQNRGMSCRVASLVRSLWVMCFLSFMTLMIHAYGPSGIRSFLIQEARALPPFGVSFRPPALSTFDEVILILIF